MKERESAMHSIVIDELELHLDGRASASFYNHLEQCDVCRQEVDAISGLSESFASLKPQADLSPQPTDAFYSKVVGRINAQQQRPSWALFSLSEPFFRRLAFASLMFLAGLGSYLVSQESSYTGADAVAIIAQHQGADIPGANAPEAMAQADQPPAVEADSVSAPLIPIHNRDYMLVTLASYQQ